MKIIGEIPARLGSKRVKKKNIRLLDGKPMIIYAIDAAKNATTLTDIYVNSESDVIGDIALKNNIKYYKRSKELATDAATSDDYNYDFIKKTDADILVQINPVSPLIESTDIDNIVKFALSNNFDTVITTKDEYLQSFYNNKPINIDINKQLSRTQDLQPIQLCCWGVCVWKATSFIKHYEMTGRGVFCGNVGFYPIEHSKTIKISTEEDFCIAEALIQYNRNKNENKTV